MTSVFSWQNSVSLWPASFCASRPNLPVTPSISWLPTFAFQPPIMKRTSFLGINLKGLVGLHRTVQLQLLQHYCLGHRVGLLWYCMVCLGNEQRSFCRFWDCTHVLHFGFPGGSAGKESACNEGDLGLIPGLGRSPGEGKAYPLQYSGLENSMGCVDHGVTNSQTWLSNSHFHFTTFWTVSLTMMATPFLLRDSCPQ